MEHLVQDTVAAVRPKLPLHTSLQEARTAVDHLNTQIVAKAIEVRLSAMQTLDWLTDKVLSDWLFDLLIG